MYFILSVIFNCLLIMILYFIPLPIFITFQNGYILYQNRIAGIWSKYYLNNIIKNSQWHPSGYIELKNGSKGFIRLYDLYFLQIIIILNVPPINYVIIDYNAIILETFWPFRAKGECFYKYISDPSKLKESMASIREYVFTTYLDGIRVTLGVTRILDGFIIKDLSSSFWRHNYLMHDLRDLCSNLAINSSSEISQYAEKATTLINNLLNQSDNYTKAQWVNISPYKALIQIQDIIQSTLRNVQYKIFGKTDAYIKMPPTAFERIILNLLNNAREAMKGVGEVRIILNNVNNFVEIILTDNGPGISKKKSIHYF